MSNLKKISLAVMQYTQDYSERYPLAQFEGSGSVGWADVLTPYHRSTRLYHCPTEGGSGSEDPTSSNYTDYWFNSNLAGQNLSSIMTPAWTLMLGDGNDGADIADARYSMSSLPLRWLSSSYSPAYRHFSGANYAYADGHVKFSRPDRITDILTSPGQATFAIK
jgi:prepilin-type processing-associated H-X9-DG protein